MARTPNSLGTLAPGVAALGAILGTAFLALGALAGRAEGGAEFLDAYAYRVAAFTVVQATLSTLLSAAFGVAVARAFARRPAFPGRRLILELFALPLVTPVIVAIFGISAVYGANGLVAAAADRLELGVWRFPYGLPGILVAHCFFNIPLVVRLVLPALESIPGETWRVAAQLGMSGRQAFRHVEWPFIRRVLPGAAGLVFLLCFTSFAVVLVFGGGPAATTIEVAIYQALRLDFEVDRAIALALLQIGLCAIVVAVGQAAFLPTIAMRAEGRTFERPTASTVPAIAIDAAWISAAAVFVGAPLCAVIYRATSGPLIEMAITPTFQAALARTVAVGATAGAAALVLGAAISVAARELRVRRCRPRLGNAVENLTALNLVISPVVLGAGLFVLLLPFGSSLKQPLALAVVVNAIATAPYVVRTLGPALDRVAEHHDRPCTALGIQGWNRLRIVEWPLVRSAAARGLALSTGLSMGDLTAIAVFGTDSVATLPYYLYRLMAAYRMDEAASVAGLLAILCLVCFVTIERLGGSSGRT